MLTVVFEGCGKRERESERERDRGSENVRNFTMANQQNRNEI